jgi:putative (di)nucleoside polyphosphate hydrolase|tara:strand:+ start:158 stop:628 length:471 start_codon:yes stop_codon:yes gene_type:complete
MSKKTLPLRIGVGAVLLNRNNQVFVGKRKDNPINKWQMPQGGVDNKEKLVDALKRELYEETSVKSYKIIHELDRWLTYELPENLLGKIWRGKYRGQKQKWFILRFSGEESEINVNTKKPEFLEWKWVDIESLPDIIVDFKKKVYEELLIEIKKTIF